MSTTVQIKYQNELVKAQELDFKLDGSNTIEYQIEDGCKVKIIVTMLNVQKIPTKLTDNGVPTYLVNSVVHTVVTIPAINLDSKNVTNIESSEEKLDRV